MEWSNKEISEVGSEIRNASGMQWELQKVFFDGRVFRETWLCKDGGLEAKVPQVGDVVGLVMEVINSVKDTSTYKPIIGREVFLKKIDGMLYGDKPEEGLDRFNAFWCSFAFRRRAFDECIAFMEKSTLKQRVSVDEIKITPMIVSTIPIIVNARFVSIIFPKILKFVVHSITSKHLIMQQFYEDNNLFIY